MFDFRNKKSRICFIGMVISLAILLIVFYATDGLLGDKEFSEYTHDDWSIAMLPLSIIIVAGVSTLAFALIIIIPMIGKYPALMEYVRKRKFADIDSDTKFLVFNHNELKRACCRIQPPNGLWVSVKEYDLNARKWKTLEEGRYIEKADDISTVLIQDYQYDQVKYYRIPDWK